MVSSEGNSEREAAADALSLATANVPTAAPADTAGEIRGRLISEPFDCAAAVAVVEDGRFVGLLAIERLLVAPPEARAATLMEADPPVVAAAASTEAATTSVARRGSATGVVVDPDGRFRGLIPPGRLALTLSREHDEDLARLGGYRAGERTARRAAEESLTRRLWHRLPWLLVGLAGAMLSAVLVGSFEDELSRVVLLAFFVPAVVYIADSVGTQTETVIIRAISVGVSIRAVARRELLTGLLLGLTVAAMFFPFATIGWGNSKVALAVALALFASCAIATAVAMTLPAILARLGFDPAFGSGPLATVIQDLLSIAIYFAIAVPLAT